jgi:hypothetical protein
MSDRAIYWQRLLTDWERSGLSQAEFCRRRRVKAVTFAWWKRRLRETQGPDAQRQARKSRRAKHAGFVEVALPVGPSAAGALRPAAMLSVSGGYELVLPGVARLHLPVDFDPERVARLLRAIAVSSVGHAAGAGGHFAGVGEHGAGCSGPPAC